MLIDLLLLIAFFIILAWSAEITVKNIKYIGNVLGIKLFAFGIVLGIITSLPEFALGINAQIDGIASLSVGNLLGGIMVVFGLVLGSSLILNREIATDGKYSTLIPENLFILSPIFLGLDGKFGILDGALMVLFYLILIFYLYKQNESSGFSLPLILDKNKILKSIFLSITGIVLVLITSHFIIEETITVLSYFDVNEMLVGILIFSIGTNLPEIIIAFTSWKKKASELSLSHLISSAFTNVFVLGSLALISPIDFNLDLNYFILGIFMAIILSLFMIFYHSDKKMERSEGIKLLFVYFIFLIISVLFN